jgi:hypothetical protein
MFFGGLEQHKLAQAKLATFVMIGEPGPIPSGLISVMLRYLF